MIEDLDLGGLPVATEDTRARPAVSLIIPTRQSWPAIAPVLDALWPQVVTARGEILVMDGTDGIDAVDPSAIRPPPGSLRVIEARGSDEFELRAHGLMAAAGQFVAIIEDHCIPAPDFLSAIAEAHAMTPRLAVAGAVTNGAVRRRVDRASFLLANARNVPPRRSEPAPGWIPTTSNISFKRAVVPNVRPAPGWLETRLDVQLLLTGQVVIDDRVVVTHVQSLGHLRMIRNHFHAGRSMGGLGRRGIGTRGAQLRWALHMTPRIPAILLRPIWEMRTRSRRDRRETLLLLPIAVTLSAADALGFACGVIAGPGPSPDRLR